VTSQYYFHFEHNLRDQQQHNFDLTNFYTNHVMIIKSNMASKSNKNDKCHDCGKDVISNDKALSCLICII
jgi:hypothetical protein